MSAPTNNFWKCRMAAANCAEAAETTPAKPSNERKATPSSKRLLPVIDPVFRAGKLDIPVEKTMPTKGRDDWLGGVLRKDLSLCCLFQKGRCHADTKCHQVHADREFVAALRAQQSTVVSCCRHCHDTASCAPAALDFFARWGARAVRVTCVEARGASNVIPADRVAFTPGLLQAAEEQPLHAAEFVISGRRVCRLHLRGACKYGKDCKNVHLCSKLGEAVLAPGFVAADVCGVAPEVADGGSSSQHSTPRSTTSTVAQQVPSVAAPPLPAFALPPPSCGPKSVDPMAVCEGSGRLGSITFDPLLALDGSQSQGELRPSAADPIFDLSPGQKRRSAGVIATGCVVPTAEQQANFLRFFML